MGLASPVRLASPLLVGPSCTLTRDRMAVAR
jgi:hypothetical protein